MKWFLLITVFLMHSIAVKSASVDELVELLKAEMKAEKPNEKGWDTTFGRERYSSLQQLIARLRQHEVVNAYNVAETLQALEQVELLAKNPKAHEMAKVIAAERRKQRQEAEDAVEAAVEKAGTEALGTALGAKSAKELDAPLAAVAKAQRAAQQMDVTGQRLRRGAGEAERVLNLLRQWQEYLAEMEAGDTKQAAQRLRNLINQDRELAGFIPRSELLAKANELEKKATPERGDPPVPAKPTRAQRERELRELIGRTKTLEDIPRALQEIAELSRQPVEEGFYMSEPANTLRNFHRIHEDLKRGLATTITLNSVHTQWPDEGGELAALRAQLILFALPRVMGLPTGEAAREGENPATFLQRILHAARERSDWPLVARVIETANSLNLTAVAQAGDARALSSFLAGLNQERAKQYLLAVASYQQALKSGSQVLPAEEIGERLEQMRKERPQEYEQGLQLAIAPPQPAQVDQFGRPISSGRPPGFPPFPMSNQPAPQPAAPAILAVPAAPSPQPVESKVGAPASPAK